MINHPRQEGKGGVEGDFDLAKIDGSAGVRRGRESMGDVIEMGESGGRMSGGGKNGGMMNKEIKLSSKVREGLNSIACRPGRSYHPGLIVTR